MNQLQHPIHSATAAAMFRLAARSSSMRAPRTLRAAPLLLEGTFPSASTAWFRPCRAVRASIGFLRAILQNIGYSRADWAGHSGGCTVRLRSRRAGGADAGHTAMTESQAQAFVEALKPRCSASRWSQSSPRMKAPRQPTSCCRMRSCSVPALSTCRWWRLVAAASCVPRAAGRGGAGSR